MTASNAITMIASNIDNTIKNTELGEFDQKLNLVSVLCSRVDSNILCEDCCSKLGSTKLSADILFSSIVVINCADAVFFFFFCRMWDILCRQENRSAFC